LSSSVGGPSIIWCPERAKQRSAWLMPTMSAGPR
jgi:hypothetical protein